MAWAPLVSMFVLSVMVAVAAGPSHGLILGLFAAVVIVLIVAVVVGLRSPGRGASDWLSGVTIVPE